MRRTVTSAVVVAAIVVLVLVLVGGAWVFRSRLAGLVGPRAGIVPVASMPTRDAAASPAASGSTPRGGVSIDPRRQQDFDVRTVKATRIATSAEIRAVGTVQNDETRIRDVNVKVEGWIRTLAVDFTGQRVAEGQPLFTLYSPDVLASESEYVLALKARDQLQLSALADARTRADALVAASRRRLGLWDLSEAELTAIATSRQASDTIEFRSPAAGVVLEKSIVQGQHVMPGQTLYKLADLSVVWIEAEVYDEELPLVHLGDRAQVTIDAYPGEHLTGRVIYIYPYVNPQTRTTRVRYEFDNGRGRLKPGMFATVVMTTPAGTSVVVPADAVLDSGTEQIVFVSEGQGHFEPRHVTLGRRLGDRIQIAAGLEDGEEVATGATFFLDSESQLRAAAQGYERPPASSDAAATSQLGIALRTTPDPMKAGENQFEAVVKDAHGAALDGAEVSVQLFMAAMPSMNMPAMRSAITLTGAGAGVYRGTGQVPTTGQWDATVVVAMNGRGLGEARLTLVAR